MNSCIMYLISQMQQTAPKDSNVSHVNKPFLNHAASNLKVITPVQFQSKMVYL